MTDKKDIILAVDDNPHNLQFLGEILEQEGYDVVLSKNGPNALEYASRQRVDLILLDIMMPQMDGIEVCTLLKKNHATKEIPVIFLTAKTETEDIVKGFETGAVDYVTKPFTTLELLARVKTHIALKKAREEIKTLRGILPVCAGCKSIRDEKGEWQSMEHYITSHSEAEFSHGLCPTCLKKYYPDVADKIAERKNKK